MPRAPKVLADSAIMRLDSDLHLLVESRHPHNLWDHLVKSVTGLIVHGDCLSQSYTKTKHPKRILHKVTNESLARLARLDTFSIIVQKAAIMKDLNTK